MRCFGKVVKAVLEKVTLVSGRVMVRVTANLGFGRVMVRVTVNLGFDRVVVRVTVAMASESSSTVSSRAGEVISPSLLSVTKPPKYYSVVWCGGCGKSGGAELW